MPDQERDDAAFAAWWARFAETYPLAKAEPKIKAAACLAWHAALAERRESQ